VVLTQFNERLEMAIKSKVNKSDEVRKLHSSGVTSGSEIVAKLKARGINVAPSQVYQVITRKKGKKASKKARHTAGTDGTVIDHAVLFVRAAGGMSNAKELLSKLSLLHN
jgi:hypothetical protein